MRREVRRRAALLVSRRGSIDRKYMNYGVRGKVPLVLVEVASVDYLEA